jgi:hypothetical protein
MCSDDDDKGDSYNGYVEDDGSINDNGKTD